ncbi:MAG: glycine cleavage system aminomethyltransferase GcvT [Chloroflexi bacterium]|nr:glycine cleavage system aminomethyltransferase GcvT [Chloroflexota bacterium]
MTQALSRTPLYDTHLSLGGKMVPFAGWDMPIQYHQGILAEARAVRSAAGLFDVSHMGRFRLRGPQSALLIDWVVTADVPKLAQGQGRYTVVCTEVGGILDDAIVYRLGPEEYLFVCNAANRSAVWAWLAHWRESRFPGAVMEDRTLEVGMIAFQGPATIGAMERLSPGLPRVLRPFRIAQASVAGISALVARTGYTGEDGFEVYLPVAESERIWNELLEAGKKEGMVPCGLGARNTLRLEAGLLLYGHDMDENTTPLECNLRWICKLEKGPFLGRNVLLEQARAGLLMLLAGFQMTDRGIARDDAPVWVAGAGEARQVGRVTSGSYVPYLKKSIGLAYLPPELARVGQRIQIEIRGNRTAAEIVPTPFYRRARN